MTLHWKHIVDVMSEKHGIQFDDGLSTEEIREIENEFSFSFPQDLAEFLNVALPVSDRFPDWRNGSRDDLRTWLDLPCAGILFDVENNDFWLPEWGDRPKNIEQTKQVLRGLIGHAPTLIPIYAHRMIPDRPIQSGNPVFSVHQTDIIYYGCDLRDYFVHEFFSGSEMGVWPIATETIRKIEFWDLDRFATRWENRPNVFDGSSETMP
jgi:hypothetical protein